MGQRDMELIDKTKTAKTPAAKAVQPAGRAKIEKIEVERYRLPLDPAFKPAWDSRAQKQLDVTLVRVTAGGAVGIGSAAGAMPATLEEYAELFVDHDPFDLDRHNAVLGNLDFHGARPWALDLALWDLVGKLRGEPVWRMLGGESGTVQCYASMGALRDAGTLVEKARKLAAAGFPAIKIRFHSPDWRDDVRALEAVRRALGDKVEIMVDCNQAWRMPWDTEPAWSYHQALVVARELERIGVYWMEEPLHRCDWRGMSVLHNAVSVRLAGGEMTREPRMLEDLVERRCVDVLQPDASQTCGITGAARLARIARAAGVAFAPQGWGDGLALLANAHLFAGCGGSPWFEFPLDPPEWTPERRDFLLAEPIKADKQGCIALGDAPGLGIVLNEEKLEKLRRA